jgi:hypothetical protein
MAPRWATKSPRLRLRRPRMKLAGVEVVPYLKETPRMQCLGVPSKRERYKPRLRRHPKGDGLFLFREITCGCECSLGWLKSWRYTLSADFAANVLFTLGICTSDESNLVYSWDGAFGHECGPYNGLGFWLTAWIMDDWPAAQWA